LFEKYFWNGFAAFAASILKFWASKALQFFAKKIKNRAHSALRTSCNRICIFFCRALRFKLRVSFSATESFHLRRRFFKISAPKTLQIFVQNSPSARVRRCAIEKITFGNCARLHLVVCCFQNA